MGSIKWKEKIPVEVKDLSDPAVREQLRKEARQEAQRDIRNRQARLKEREIS